MSARSGKSIGYARNDATDWITLKDHHTGLVPRSVAEQAAERMTQRRCTPGNPRIHRLVYPLSGKIRCLNYTGRMNGNAQDSKGYHYRRYMCSSYFQNRSCETYIVDAPRLERLILARLKEAYLVDPADRDAFRQRVVVALRQRAGEGSGESEVVKRLKLEQAEFETKIQGAINNIAVVPQEAARRLGEQVEEWSKQLDRSRLDLAQHEGRAARAMDVEAAADEVMGMVDEIAETAKDASTDVLRRLYGRVIESIELSFETVVVTTKVGTQRKRHRCIEGAINGNGLLDYVQQAGCLDQLLLG